MLYHSGANGVYLCPKGRISQATDLRRLQKCVELQRAKEAELILASFQDFGTCDSDVSAEACWILSVFAPERTGSDIAMEGLPDELASRLERRPCALKPMERSAAVGSFAMGSRLRSGRCRRADDMVRRSHQ
jgi:hypothetical protein